MLRTAGVLYLASHGIRSLRDALAPSSIAPRVPPPGKPRRSLQNAYEGFRDQCVDPAIASFYLVVMPQFIPRGAPVVGAVLTPTGVHIAIATGSHVAAAGGTLARNTAGGRPRQVLEVIAGGAFLTLAVRIALG